MEVLVHCGVNQFQSAMPRIQQSELIRVKDEFFRRGESVAEWSAKHGFTTNSVYQVLSGRCQASRGESHRIAVALGLKITPVCEESAGSKINN